MLCPKISLKLFTLRSSAGATETTTELYSYLNVSVQKICISVWECVESSCVNYSRAMMDTWYMGARAYVCVRVPMVDCSISSQHMDFGFMITCGCGVDDDCKWPTDE